MIIAVAIFAGEKIAVDEAVEAGILFAELTEEDSWAHVKTGYPMDKVGTHGIQSGSAAYVERCRLLQY